MYCTCSVYIVQNAIFFPFPFCFFPYFAVLKGWKKRTGEDWIDVKWGGARGTDLVFREGRPNFFVEAGNFFFGVGCGRGRGGQTCSACSTPFSLRIYLYYCNSPFLLPNKTIALPESGIVGKQTEEMIYFIQWYYTRPLRYKIRYPQKMVHQERRTERMEKQFGGRIKFLYLYLGNAAHSIFPEVEGGKGKKIKAGQTRQTQQSQHNAKYRRRRRSLEREWEKRPKK